MLSNTKKKLKSSNHLVFKTNIRDFGENYKTFNKKKTVKITFNDSELFDNDLYKNIFVNKIHNPIVFLQADNSNTAPYLRKSEANLLYNKYYSILNYNKLLQKKINLHKYFFYIKYNELNYVILANEDVKYDNIKNTIYISYKDYDMITDNKDFNINLNKNKINKSILKNHYRAGNYINNQSKCKKNYIIESIYEEDFINESSINILKKNKKNNIDSNEYKLLSPNANFVNDFKTNEKFTENCYKKNVLNNNNKDIIIDNNINITEVNTNKSNSIKVLNNSNLSLSKNLNIDQIEIKNNNKFLIDSSKFNNELNFIEKNINSVKDKQNLESNTSSKDLNNKKDSDNKLNKELINNNKNHIFIIKSNKKENKQDKNKKKESSNLFLNLFKKYDYHKFNFCKQHKLDNSTVNKKACITNNFLSQIYYKTNL